MKLTYVTLYVRDLPAVRRWYVEQLGLAEAYATPAFAMVVSEGARLGLHVGEPLDHPERVQIHFEVPDVDAAYERLKGQGLAFLHGPKNTPWGFRVAPLRDPAGHTVELYTPIHG